MSNLIGSHIRISMLSSASAVRFYLMSEFGAGEPSKFLDRDVNLQAFSALQPDYYVEWRRAMAEELLLLHACGRKVPKHLSKQFADASPFGTGHPVRLKDCLGRKCACATFPLASKPSPGIGHVWIVKGLGHRDKKDGIDVIPDGCGICFTTTQEAWKGRSWQLAGIMAFKAVEARPGSPAQGDLQDWIFTGRISNGSIHNVHGISSKGIPLRERCWLFPRENAEGDDYDKLRRKLRMVYSESSVDSALALVSGRGTCFHRHSSDRIECDEMHALIGLAPEPIISVFLLSTAKRFILWHSENTTSTAEKVRDVVGGLVPAADIEMCLMPSDSIVSAERCIWTPLADCADKKVVINVTGGNRLMSFAAHTMAKLFDNISLVYRDTDAPPHEIMEIIYRQNNPSEAKLLCRPHRCKQYSWDVLYANNSGRHLKAGDILSEMGFEL